MSNVWVVSEIVVKTKNDIESGDTAAAADSSEEGDPAHSPLRPLWRVFSTVTRSRLTAPSPAETGAAVSEEARLREGFELVQHSAAAREVYARLLWQVLPFDESLRHYIGNQIFQDPAVCVAQYLERDRSFAAARILDFIDEVVLAAATTTPAPPVSLIEERYVIKSDPLRAGLGFETYGDFAGIETMQATLGVVSRLLALSSRHEQDLMQLLESLKRPQGAARCRVTSKQLGIGCDFSARTRPGGLWAEATVETAGLPKMAVVGSVSVVIRSLNAARRSG